MNSEVGKRVKFWIFVGIVSIRVEIRQPRFQVSKKSFGRVFNLKKLTFFSQR